MNAFLFHGTWPAKKPWLDGVPDIITGEPRPGRGNFAGSRIKNPHKMHKNFYFMDRANCPLVKAQSVLFFENPVSTNHHKLSHLCHQCVTGREHRRRHACPHYIYKGIHHQLNITQNTGFLWCFIKVVVSV